MDYFIRINVYVKQEDVIYLKNINVEELEDKVEKFVDKNTKSKTTDATIRIIPCIAANNTMDIVFSDFDEDDDYDYDEEDLDEFFSWIEDDKLNFFFKSLLPIEIDGLAIIESVEAMHLA